MKDTAPLPPDMSNENARELKQLQHREAKLTRDQSRASLRDAARSRVIDGLVDRERQRLLREMSKALKAFAKPLRAEQANLQRHSKKTKAGHTPEAAELTAIRRRIAILRGKLGS